MDSEINYMDLFSGAGGFALGLSQAGFEFKNHYFSEIDQHAIAVYKHKFKNAQYVGDVKSVSRRTIKEQINLITFGFPCQDLSIAGRGAGLNGSRSGLFFEAIRIVEEFKPEVFIFENVKGLLSSNEGKDFEIVLRTIADLGLYECEWQLINTAWVLPQNRERVYFVGHLGRKSRPRVFPFRKGDSVFTEGNRQGKGKGEYCTAITQNYHKGVHNQGETYVVSHYGHKNKPPQVNDISPTLKAESHGHEPMIVQKTGGYTTTIKENITGTLQAGGANVMDKVPNVYVPSAVKQGYEIAKEGDSINFQNLTSKTRKGRVGKGKAQTIDTSQSMGVLHKGNIRRLTERDCELLQGFPVNWTDYGLYLNKKILKHLNSKKKFTHPDLWDKMYLKAIQLFPSDNLQKISRTQRYKLIGNAVTVNWPKMIGQRLLNN